MYYEEKDFLLRQIKSAAYALGGLLSKESLKELINYQQSETVTLSDAEIETIILVVEAKNKGQREGLSSEETASVIGLEPKIWQELYEIQRVADEKEIAQIKAYLAKAALI